MQAVLQIMDGQRLLAVEYNEIVPVTLVVAEEEVLAMLRAVVVPVLAGDLDGRGLGVFVPRVADPVGIEPVEDPLPAFVDRRQGDLLRLHRQSFFQFSRMLRAMHSTSTSTASTGDQALWGESSSRSGSRTASRGFPSSSGSWTKTSSAAPAS